MTGRRNVGVALTFVAGASVAAQSRVNGELGVRLGDGITAAVVSFAAGLVVVSLLVLVTPAGRRGVRRLWAALGAGSLRWWHCLGGVCGGFVVATQGATVGILGVAVFTVAVVAGQSASSLAVDRAGLGPGGPRPVTAARLVGAALCVAAIVVAVGDRLTSPRVLGLAALPLLAGIGAAWQQAVNGRVRAAAAATLPATLVNFVVGTVALLLAYAVAGALRGWPDSALPNQPWLYLGGPIGVLFISVAAAVVRFTGVLLLGLAMTAGQVFSALVLDVVAPVDGLPAGNAYLGAALTLVAVAVAAGRLGRNRDAAPASAPPARRAAR